MHTAKLCVAATLLLSACGGDGTASITVGPGGAADGDCCAQDAPAPSAPTTPDATIEAAFAHLKNKRVSDFVMLMVPPDDVKKAREGWAEMRKEPIEDAQDEEMQRVMGMLTADGAEATLFAMVQPKLAEAQQQIGMLAAFGPRMAAGAVEQSGAPAASQAMLESFIGKVAEMNIGSEDNAKKAIAIACKAAREINLPNGAAVQKLTFDQALGKADIAFAAVTDALAVYGFDFTSTFDSIETKVLSTEGDVAKVEVTVSLLGFPAQTVPVTMERIDGRWYGKKEPKAESPAQPSATDGAAR